MVLIVERLASIMNNSVKVHGAAILNSQLWAGEDLLTFLSGKFDLQLSLLPGNSEIPVQVEGRSLYVAFVT